MSALLAFSPPGFELILDLNRLQIYNENSMRRFYSQLQFPFRAFFCLFFTGFVLNLGVISKYCYASSIPPELKEVGITERLGETVSISELSFKDEAGKDVKLSQYFQQGHPVLLNLVYYECPNLCNFVLNGLVKSLKTLDWTPGVNFEIVTVSIDPKEAPSLAEKKKAAYMKEYGRTEAAPGWHFLTGEEPNIKKLAEQVGFGYKYDTREKQYAHSAGIFALTPTGKISRILYGIEFKSTELKLALLEASNGQVGTVIDRFLLFCYRYDPNSRKYSLYLTQVMQAACAVTVIIFGAYLTLFWRRQRKGA
ncbi:MAG: SCO family protein [Bdellovibrionia bacterium]